MKKVLSLVLVAVMLMASVMMFSGCGASGDKLTGKWEATVDMAEVLNQSIAGTDETIGEYINFDDFTLKIMLELNEDGTYKMYADEAAASKAFEGLKDKFEDGMIKYIEATIESTGLELSVEDFLDMAGMSLDDLIEQALGDAVLDSMIDEMYTEGQYKAENGKFYTSNDLDNEPTANGEEYELNGNTLTINGGEGQNNEMYDLIYPLVFSRVG